MSGIYLYIFYYLDLDVSLSIYIYEVSLNAYINIYTDISTISISPRRLPSAVPFRGPAGSKWQAHGVHVERWMNAWESWLRRVTLPKFNIAPENRPKPKRKLVFQPSFFRGYVKLRGGRFWVWFSAPKTAYRIRVNGWESGSPKSGIGGIVHLPIGSIYYLYTTYSPCLLGGYMLPTTF